MFKQTELDIVRSDIRVVQELMEHTNVSTTEVHIPVTE
ncbi:uncharacterized protein METZ01_LOCUS400252, partial [marine metagenome]